VARIDISQPDRLSITFFDDIFFDTSQLVQFIYRRPNYKALDEACVQFLGDTVWFTFLSQTRGSGGLSRNPVWRVLLGAFGDSAILYRALVSFFGGKLLHLQP
jgi:hypothetical protein